jgi:hypothetical protein
VTDPLDAVEPETALHAGAAAYTAGELHAAQAILTAPETPLLDGLAAFVGTVAAARAGNWGEARALADRAARQLAAADPTTHGVETAPLQRWLGAFRADPERIERAPAPPIFVDGELLVPGTLPLAAAGVAAAVVAEMSAYDGGVVADAIRFAEQTARPDESRYATFLRDFVGDPTQRPIVFQRLSSMIDRERRKERDVSGLFEETDEE